MVDREIKIVEAEELLGVMTAIIAEKFAQDVVETISGGESRFLWKGKGEELELVIKRKP